jgi:antirestriction protein ArdC
VIERGFSTQNWLTFRQALSLGGNVRKGEHGTTVVYGDRFTSGDERLRAERDGDEPGADFRIGGDRTFYNTAHDFIQAPPPEAYF